MALIFSCEAHAWSSSNTFDEMTDEKIGFTSTISLNGSAAAYVKCFKDVLLVGLIWPEVLSFTERSRYVDFRFDKADPGSSYYEAIKGEKAETESDARRLIFLMKEHNRLLMQTNNYAGNTMTEKFSLSGFTKSYNEACGWWEQKNP